MIRRVVKARPRVGLGWQMRDGLAGHVRHVALGHVLLFFSCHVLDVGKLQVDASSKWMLGASAYLEANYLWDCPSDRSGCVALDSIGSYHMLDGLELI